ncbi:MAG TPA: flagellar basal body P-ring formation chaperone FlgA [Candidatus Baltobacteraceae bacterium]|nr:flagellar basal body P-ring formation chaperone FlgA [Candidatus Baltobacteraceae bacterium]
MRTAALLLAVLLSCAPLAANASGIGLQKVSGKTIAALASQQIASLARNPDANYTQVSQVADQVVSDGRVHLRAQSPIGTPQFVNVPVQIEVDGHLDRTVLVGYRVQQLAETAVASHDLAPGTVISADDVQLAKLPLNGRPANGTDVLVGRRLLATVSKGSPVTVNDTQVNQIVKAGSTVVFTIRNGGVVISADATARTGGGIGDQVIVFNNETHKQLTGTVTGPNAVELDITEGSTP